LSGFIEAEGCFSIRANGHHSFSIGQNQDYFILEAIRNYFESNNIIREPYLVTEGASLTKFYFIEIYKKSK